MDKSQLDAWQQADALFEYYFDKPFTSSLAEIKERKDISKEVKQKLLQLLQSQPQDNTTIDEVDLSFFSSMEAPQVNLSGENIDEYHLLRQIGKGGMSVVYQAERINKSIQKFVAVKVLTTKKDGNDNFLQNLFQQEQLTLAQLHHKNIVSFHHGGISNAGNAYLVTEYIESAESISNFCKKNGLNSKQIVALVLPLLDAITYAHQQLIIHKDIKPSNFIVDAQGTPYLLDFGIADLLDSMQDKQSLELYTPDYASPEQILKQPLSVSTDIFSFSATLLELLTDKKPLPKFIKAEYQPQQDTLHINTLLKNSHLDTDLKNILQKGLAIKPQERYQSMLELKLDLQNWQQNKAVLASKQTKRYFIKKFIQRHPISFFLVSSLLIAITFALYFMFMQMQQANFEAKKSQLVTDFLIESIQSSDPDITKGKDISLKEFLINSQYEINQSSQLEPLLASTLKQTIGSALAKVGAYKDAEKLLSQALASDQNNFDARLALLQLYSDLQQFDAMQVHFAFIKQHEKHLSQQQSISLKQIKAVQQFRNGEFNQAIETISAILNSKNINALQKIKSQLILADILDEKGQSKQAAKVLQQALQISQQKYSELSTITISIYKRLTKVLTNYDDVPFTEIVSIYHKLIANEKTIFGDKHPQLAKTYLQYGFLLKVMGKNDEAKKHAQLARKISLENFGEKHILTAHIDLLLSQLLLIDNNRQAATNKLENIVKIYRQTYGDDHFETNQVKTTLAFYYLTAQKPQQALDLLLPLYRSQKQQLGATNKATLYVVANILKAYNMTGENTKAIELGQKSLTLSQEKLGKTFAITIGIQANLAENYLSTGNTEHALKLLLPLLEMPYIKHNPAYTKKITTLIHKAQNKTP